MNAQCYTHEGAEPNAAARMTKRAETMNDDIFDSDDDMVAAALGGLLGDDGAEWAIEATEEEDGRMRVTTAHKDNDTLGIPQVFTIRTEKFLTLIKEFGVGGVERDACRFVPATPAMSLAKAREKFGDRLRGYVKLRATSKWRLFGLTIRNRLRTQVQLLIYTG